MDFETTLEPLVLKAIKAIESTGDFLVEQTPLVIQEFIMWKTVEHSMMIVVALFLCIGVPFILSRFLGSDSDDYSDFSIFNKHFDLSDFGAGLYKDSIFLVLSIILCCVGVGIFLHHAFSLAEVIIAPKVYLLEYFTMGRNVTK